MRFDVKNVDGWAVVSQEPGGALPKDWLSPPEYAGSEQREQWWLFKPVKVGTRRLVGGGEGPYRRYDDTVERLACALGGLIELPRADVELARRGPEEGIISRNVAPNGWTMDGGDVRLSEISGYVSCQPDNRPRNRVGHNLVNIETVLTGVSGPPGPCETWPAFEVFAGYLVFDAWIGNTDRHAMNWAVMQCDAETRLAPSFDHGSALASGSTDVELASKQIDDFCRGGTASRFEDGSSMSLVQLAQNAVRAAGGRSAEWLGRIAAVQDHQIDEVVSGVPGLSDLRRTFLVGVLTQNRRRLTE